MSDGQMRVMPGIALLQNGWISWSARPRSLPSIEMLLTRWGSAEGLHQYLLFALTRICTLSQSCPPDC
jgi:hypothetical protein